MKRPARPPAAGLRWLLAAAMLAAWPGAVGGQALPEKPSPSLPRPNFVFILADDWGWGDLGCYGHDEIRTPNLDRLAAQGTRFTQFYDNGSVCSPSRTALMTGRFPARFQIHGPLADLGSNAKRGMPNFLDPDALTVTRLLREAGYATAHFGKWHLGHRPGAPPPPAYGLDVHRAYLSTGLGWDDERQPGFFAASSGRIVDETIQFIETNRDRPFYVQAWLLDVHGRLQPTEEQLAAYPSHTGAPRIYYAAATNADRQIGRLLDRLKALGLERNTVVIFSSDNGPEDIALGNAAEHGVGSPGPFRGRKRSLYEGGVRVPFILRWPAGGASPGAVDDTTVLSGVDFLPTVCALAGVPVPAGLPLDGEDLSPAFRGTPRERSRPLFWEWRFRIFGHVINRSPMLSVREGRWKLLMNPDRSRIEIYDIPADPGEMNNLADRNPDVVRRLSEALLAWRATLPPGPVEAGAGSNAYPWPK